MILARIPENHHPKKKHDYIYIYIYEGTNLKRNEYLYFLKIFRYNFIYHVQPPQKVHLPFLYESTWMKGDIFSYFNGKTWKFMILHASGDGQTPSRLVYLYKIPSIINEGNDTILRYQRRWGLFRDM